MPAARLSVAGLRTIQLQILRRFARFCDANDLVYYLYGGTLLGAVVHRGYIPWDDDIDLIMPRSDYERFRALLVGDGLLPGLEVVDERTGRDHPYPFIKLGKSGTVLIDHTAGGRRFPINVDVFPLDEWPREGVGRRVTLVVHDLLVKYVEAVLTTRAVGWRAPVCALARVVGRVFSPNRAARVLTWVAQRGNGSASGQCGLLSWGQAKAMPAEAFTGQRSMEFEGEAFAVPADPDEILSRGYGPGFRVIPPKERQVAPHGYDAFADLSRSRR
ncbi:MAG: LicD family protein [Nocardioides sp.]